MSKHSGQQFPTNFCFKTHTQVCGLTTNISIETHKYFKTFISMITEGYLLSYCTHTGNNCMLSIAHQQQVLMPSCPMALLGH